MKKGKTTRPFRYDPNQIPYNYTVEVTNRFKGLDLTDRVPEELWTEVRDTVQEAGIKTIPKKKKCKKAKRFCLKPNIQKKKKPNIQKTKIMSSGPITSWQIDEETMATVRDFILGGSKITADGDCSHEIKTVAPLKKIYDQSRQHIKKQSHYFANKGLSSKSYGYTSSHVWT